VPGSGEVCGIGEIAPLPGAHQTAPTTPRRVEKGKALQIQWHAVGLVQPVRRSASGGPLGAPAGRAVCASSVKPSRPAAVSSMVLILQTCHAPAGVTAGTRCMRCVTSPTWRAGVHLESLAEAEAAARVLLHRLPTLTLPYTLPLLGGRMRAWLAGAADLAGGLGGGGGPAGSGEGLPPSVRCALEAAALSALAAARGVPLAEMLLGGGELGMQHVHTHPARRPAASPAGGVSLGQQGGDEPGGDGGGPACSEPAVAVNGLVAAEGAAACAAEAAALAAAGFTTLKIKARHPLARGGAARARRHRCAHAVYFCRVKGPGGALPAVTVTPDLSVPGPACVIHGPACPLLSLAGQPASALCTTGSGLGRASALRGQPPPVARPGPLTRSG